MVSAAGTTESKLSTLNLGIANIGVEDPSKWKKIETDDEDICLACNAETGQTIIVKKTEDGNKVSLVDKKPDGDSFGGTMYGFDGKTKEVAIDFRDLLNYVSDPIKEAWGAVKAAVSEPESEEVET